MHIIIWEFEVPESHWFVFEQAYGPSGDWARLFAESASYVGTDLLRSKDDPARYLTIDTWRSAADCDRFMIECREAYQALDKRCAGFTTDEKLLGSFLSAGST